MYQVLYRKYRPKSFDDVYGQNHVTDTLRNELRLNRVHHAYLFTGSRGTGKTTCAKILSKAVNCLNPHDGDPCGECENCRGIDNGEVLDVVEMDAASNRGIDDIRAIIDEVAFAPAKAKYRVYIVDEVHMLSRDAWNALLKTLEEPPSHVVFILATTEVNKIPETILSRCQRFDFHRISPADISARLFEIAESEGVSLSDEAALLISVIADGAMRDAISLLDRCIGISDDVTAEVVRSAAGLAAQGHIFELVNSTVNKNVKRALEIIDSLYNDSKDMGSLCEELLSHFRSLMLIKTVSDPRKLVVMSDREFDAALGQSDYLSLADILYNMEVLSKARSAMRDSVSPRTELEMALVKLCAPELEQTDGALFSRVTALEKAVKLLQSGAYTPAVAKPEPVESTPKPAAKAQSSAETKAKSGADTLDETAPKADEKPAKSESKYTPAPINDAVKSTSPADEKSEYIDAPPTPTDDNLPPWETDEPQAPKADSSPLADAPAAQTATTAEPKPTVTEVASKPLSQPEPEQISVPQSEQSAPRDTAPQPIEPQQQRKKPSSASRRQQVDMAELYRNAVPFSLWSDVVSNLRHYSRAISAAFANTNAYESGDYLLIETDHEIAFELLKKSAQREEIRKAVQEVTGKVYKLGPYKMPEATVSRDDVLDNFINQLKSAGVNVTEE